MQAKGEGINYSLFDDSIVPEKTFEEEYKEYIASTKWKQKREQVLRRAKYRCERCGVTKWTSRLEVHHKTYDNFKQEPLEELEVVCKGCHEKADKERQEQVLRKKIARQAEALYNAQFQGWAEKVIGEYWYLDPNAEYKFDQWLEDRGYD